jgi:hypothetical protein
MNSNLCTLANVLISLNLECRVSSADNVIQFTVDDLDESLVLGVGLNEAATHLLFTCNLGKPFRKSNAFAGLYEIIAALNLQESFGVSTFDANEGQVRYRITHFIGSSDLTSEVADQLTRSFIGGIYMNFPVFEHYRSTSRVRAALAKAIT